MSLHGTKALETWCRRVTKDYPGVNILNMTTSWRNGLGFCAIIHHHCPDLLDFESLDPDDVFANNELAFQVAEQHLGVPSLLDPRDMVECELLDRLSILTYLSQYFQAFHSQSVQTRVRRIGSISKSPSANSDLSEGGKRQAPMIGRHSDPCRVCSKSVFILERLNVGGRILHRTCFKCARCSTQLSLAGYYETEAGEYCCELCPDEENTHQKQTVVRPHVDLQQSDQADSGHSSEDSKDIEDESDEKKPEEDINDEVEKNVEAVLNASKNAESLTNESAEETTASLIALNTEIDKLEDENANVQRVEESTLNKVSQGCSIVEIDENENNVDAFEGSTVVKECTQSITNMNITSDVKEDIKNPFDDEDDDKDEYVNDEDKNIIETEVFDINNDNSNNATGDNLCIDHVSGINVKSEIKPVESFIPSDNHSLNPFGSDIESDDEESKPTPSAQTSQVMRLKSESNDKSLNPFGTGFSSDEDCSLGSVSPSLSLRSHTKSRKKRRAPLPPGSSPNTLKQAGSHFPTPAPRTSLTPRSARSSRMSSPYAYTPPAETAKRIKDENNMNRRSQILESIKNEGTRGQLSSIPSDSNLVHHSDASLSDTVSMNQSDSLSLMSASTTTQSSVPSSSAAGTSQIFSPLADKADEGQWRKKKGPAPPRPIPPKRIVTKLHRKAINQELVDIEIKQSEMERQGVKLEKTIREICDKSDEDGENRDSLGPEAEDLIIQLFDLVNEKNELFRRQTELIYMKKDNRLEEQHADLEYQIRILMSKPEAQKSEEDARKEETLIKKLCEVVGLRNEIVDCLEMDRLRERDEDTAIEDHMSNYAAVKQPEEPKKGISKMLRIKKKKKKKDKDDEKDVDTSEVPETDDQASSEKKKKSAKKKLLKYASKKLTFPH